MLLKEKSCGFRGRRRKVCFWHSITSQIKENDEVEGLKGLCTIILMIFVKIYGLKKIINKINNENVPNGAKNF